MSKNNRILWLDYAKALTMYLVVYGHCQDFFMCSDLNLRLTGFMMPLFMLLSGLFVCKSLTLPILVFFSKITKCYLIPYLLFCIIWGCIYWKQYEFDFLAFLNGPWFVRDLIFFYIIIYIGNKISRGKPILTIIASYIILLLLPTNCDNQYNWQQYIQIKNSTQFLFPFFLAGFYVSIIRDRLYYIWKNIKLYYLILPTICLLYYFKFDYSFYTNPHYSLTDFLIKESVEFDVWYLLLLFYRYVVGFVASFTLLKVCKWFNDIDNFYKVKCLIGKFGQQTLGIYLIHSLFFIIIGYFSNLKSIFEMNLFTMFVVLPILLYCLSYLISVKIINSPLKWVLGR